MYKNLSKIVFSSKRNIFCQFGGYLTIFIIGLFKSKMYLSWGTISFCFHLELFSKLCKNGKIFKSHTNFLFLYFWNISSLNLWKCFLKLWKLVNIIVIIVFRNYLLVYSNCNFLFCSFRGYVCYYVDLFQTYCVFLLAILIILFIELLKNRNFSDCLQKCEKITILVTMENFALKNNKSIWKNN